MQIRQMGPIGAEIVGVDLKSIDDAIFGRIYQTWLDCNVICVRDQELRIDDFLAYSKRFGSVSPHPSKSTRHPDCPEVTLLGVNNLFQRLHRLRCIAAAAQAAPRRPLWFAYLRRAQADEPAAQ
ncbi:MAG: TauD/TfdA family dioxygenase [Proteobacteria bacterium]|nr:TauD/TfdA family dioxygenase [Pseudomonadota bacterium]